MNCGAENENLVEEALLNLRDRKKIEAIPPIKQVIHSYPNSNMDRQGIDFLVRFENGHDVPIQVKSSARAARKFEGHCRKKGVFIPVVVVFSWDKVGTIINRIVKCIKLVFTMIQRSINGVRCTENKKAARQLRRRRYCRRFNLHSMAH